MQTKYVVADFSNGKEIYDNIKYALSTIPVGILGEFIEFFSSFYILNA